jgi:hypothetical protein
MRPYKLKLSVKMRRENEIGVAAYSFTSRACVAVVAFVSCVQALLIGGDAPRANAKVSVSGK